MLAFVHIHKTAGTTLNWILRSSFGLRHLDVEPWDQESAQFDAQDYQKLMRIALAPESIAGHLVRAYSDLQNVRPDVRYYTYLREPVTRMASLYQHGVQKGNLTQSPEQWLEGRYNGQTIRIAGKDDVDEAIRLLETKFFFVGDVKHFDESLLLLQAQANHPKLQISLQSRNVAASETHKRSILDNKRLVEMIKEQTKNDQILYDYMANEIYPRQRKAYGKTLESDLASLRNQSTVSTYNAALFSNLVYRRGFYRPLLKSFRVINKRN